MISKEEIKKLADLARIEIGDIEAEKLGGEMDAVLGYLNQVKEITEGKEADTSLNVRGVETKSGGDINGMVNVLREDTNPTESETHSKELIAEFPASEGNYLKVKKIL
jgi:aspartyl/glutamyl-tRNA(Asn/Gln) amidotransferase C subunit